MKKIILSLAGILTAAAFAPEASALPVFARQTGMACKACHFQHFPLLNSFGRAFKAGAYTMIGAQGKVEDEGLSIPNTLNLGALATTGYETVSNRANAPGATVGTSNGQYLFPADGGELSIFFGGRVTDSIGFLSELALTGTGAGPANTNSAKIPMLFDVGNNTRVGLVAMATAGQGAAHSFELLNTGAANTHRMVTVNGPVVANGGAGVHTNVVSAAQYLGTNGRANGFSFVAVNPNMGFVNIGKYGVSNTTTTATGCADIPPPAPGAACVTPTYTTAATAGGTLQSGGVNGMNTTYVRAAAMFNVGGWDSAVGVQSFSGRESVNNLGTNLETKASIVDGQMQGEAGGMPLGLYASYGTAPSTTAGNIFNAAVGVGTNSRRSFNVGGELGVIPHKATVMLAFRSGKNGAGTNAAAILAAGGTGDSDNAILLGGTYELAQNAELSLMYTSNSGSAWNTVGGIEPFGKTVTNLTLGVLF